MAGSFHVFRKNQKLFMALAAIMAIFVFVFADMVTSSLQNAASNAQGSPSATLVTWDGGSLSTNELNALGRRHYFINDFLRELQSQGYRTILEEGGTPLEPTVPSFMFQQMFRQENPASSTVMVGAVRTRIIAELASEAGMTVTDEMINRYLREFGLGKVTDAEISEILKRTSRTTASHGEQQLFAGLRELLLQNNYMRSYMPVIRNVLPEQRWDDWQQINRRIALEAAIFPNDQFLGELPEPTDADIQELYDQFKDQLGYRPERVAGGAQMNSPDPGFRVPRKVRVQFLQGDVNVWIEKMLDQVTDEEIADYYERNKRTQFVDVDLFSTDSSEEEASETEESSEESSEESTEESTEEKPEPDETEASESGEEAAKESESSEEAPEESAEESETEPESSPTEEPESTESESTEPQSTEPASEESEPAPAADESSSARRVSPFRLVSLQEESGEETEESSAEEAPEEDAAPAETEPAEETPESTSEEAPEESTNDSQEEADTEEDSEEDTEEKPVEYTPLEEVSDEIRRRLANDKAVVELEKVMGRAFAELQSEYNRYGGDLVRAKTEERDPPAPPAKLANLDAMAADLGLTSEVLVPHSYPELRETRLGKARDSQTNRIPVADAAFVKSQLQLYEPFLAQDLDGHWYLAIKVEDIESSVPPLEEVRDDVVSAWKTREAAKVALERAQMLGTEAEKTGGTLAGFFADKNFEVVTTDLFSRLTFGTTPVEMRQGARLGEAPPLASIDLGFLNEAFDLKADQIVALLNHDQTFAYVLRLDRREKTEEELHQLFLLEANEWFGRRIMGSARMQNAQQALLGQLTQRVGLDASKLEEYLQPNDR